MPSGLKTMSSVKPSRREFLFVFFVVLVLAALLITKLNEKSNSSIIGTSKRHVMVITDKVPCNIITKNVGDTLQIILEPK